MPVLIVIITLAIGFYLVYDIGRTRGIVKGIIIGREQVIKEDMLRTSSIAKQVANQQVEDISTIINSLQKGNI